MQIKKMYGGIEAGGTKFICAVGSGSGELIKLKEIPTSSPTETLAEVVDFFKGHNYIEAIGIGSFGPVNLNIHSLNYGRIMNTPKPDWSDTNIYNSLKNALAKKIILATDTDVAAIGEYYHGIGLGIDNFVYLTVGTGIGGSIMSNGKLVHGLSHSEMGHIRIPMTLGNNRRGACPYHQDCLESVGSGKSIEMIYGQKPEHIDDNEVWAREASHIALALSNIVMITQPERIIIGGSVAKKDGLIDQVQSHVLELINQYIELPDINSYIVHASSDSIGVLGAIKLASLFKADT